MGLRRLGPEDSPYLSAVHARYVVPGRTLFVFRTAYLNTTANGPWRSRRGLISRVWIAQHQPFAQARLPHVRPERVSSFSLQCGSGTQRARRDSAARRCRAAVARDYAKHLYVVPLYMAGRGTGERVAVHSSAGHRAEKKTGAAESEKIAHRESSQFLPHA